MKNKNELTDLENAIYEELRGSIKYHFKNNLNMHDNSLILSMVMDILNIIEDHNEKD